MSTAAKPVASVRSQNVQLELATIGDAAIVRISGMIDEHFPGFGEVGSPTTLVLDVSGLSFISSFGVRQWLISMAALPSSAQHVYLAGCPPMFVDQLNMIRNFGGRAQILTLRAPYVCTKCGAESDETIDVVTHLDALRQGELPPAVCRKCGSALEIDVILESFLQCLTKYAPTDVQPQAIELLTGKAPSRKIGIAAKKKRAGGGRGFPLGIVIAVVVLAAIVAGVYMFVRPA